MISAGDDRAAAVDIRSRENSERLYDFDMPADADRRQLSWLPGPVVVVLGNETQLVFGRNPADGFVALRARLQLFADVGRFAIRTPIERRGHAAVGFYRLALVRRSTDSESVFDPFYEAPVHTIDEHLRPP